jgi:hypothetical protein
VCDCVNTLQATEKEFQGAKFLQDLNEGSSEEAAKFLSRYVEMS